MTQYYPVKIQTPKKFLLNGLLMNQNVGNNFYIFIHGLSGSIFSQIELLKKIAGTKNSVLTFNNRGNGIISKIKQVDAKEVLGYKTHNIGMAHEVFTDCLDDIEGAINYANEMGAKNIFLIGHSTGCQKSIYYLSKKPNSFVKGAVLLAPMSDFADTFVFNNKKVYQKAVAYARKKISLGRQHDLLPSNIWPQIIDAQRFLSLYTPDSQEEIFSYVSGKNPIILKKVKKPIFVILAANDEYKDRSMNEIADWFGKKMINHNIRIDIIDNALHGFGGHVEEVAKKILDWSK